MNITIPTHLTDVALMSEVPRLVGDERVVTARLIAHLAEVEARELYVPAGFDSLYVYCREGLGLSEDAAYNRKTAAQVARRFPVVLDMLADGRLSLTAVKLLAPVLTRANHDDVLAAATGRSKFEVEKLVAALNPKPDVRSTVRKLPAPSAMADPAAGTPAVPERQVAETGHSGESDQPGLVFAPAPTIGKPPPSTVAPLAPERYRVQFTIGEESEKALRRLQELLKREIPSGDPAAIYDRALKLLLAHVERRKNGVTEKMRTRKATAPARANSRYMPAAVRREVSGRDGGQCAFVAADGRRCTARAFIEYHHAGTPYAHGGPATTENIALHCRAHNAYEGRRIFGRPLPREIREARIAYEASWAAAAQTSRAPRIEKPAG
jgi:hypothetical protein